MQFRPSSRTVVLLAPLALAAAGLVVQRLVQSVTPTRRAVAQAARPASAPQPFALDHGVVPDLGAPAGLWAANPTQGFETSFCARGPRIQAFDGGWSLGWSLLALTRGTRREVPLEATPVVRGERVEYRRGGLLEWYENRPDGLEQGFTLATRPLAREAGALVLEFELEGDLGRALDEGGVCLLAGDGTRVATLDGLVAWDATGRELAARFDLVGGRLALGVEDAHARYPITIDPVLSSEQAELMPSDPLPGTGFGNSVEIDGDVAVVGRRYGGTEINFYIFERQQGSWTQVARLSDPFTGDLAFASHIALDGDTLAVGDPLEREGPGTGQPRRGAVYVYQRGPLGWSAVQTLQPATLPGFIKFGSDVDLDGDTLVVGARGFYGNPTPGRVYVFERDAQGEFQLVQELFPSDSDGRDCFGSRVSLFGDSLAVSAVTKDVGSNSRAGKVYVFERSGGAFVETDALLSDLPGSYDLYGHGLALYAGRLAVGSHRESFTGVAYVYEQTVAGWAREAALLAPNPTYLGYHGLHLELTRSQLLVQDRTAASFRGSVLGYEACSTSSWRFDGEHFPAGLGSSERFGSAIDVDGDVALIGARGRSGGVGGRAFVYGVVRPDVPYCASAPNSSGRPARLLVEGCLEVARNDFGLAVRDLPPRVHGLFFAGRSAIVQPFGDGVRCVGGASRRIQPAVAADSAGDVVHGVDLSGPALAPLAQPGDTTRFQFWYRDPMGPGGSGFNTSDATAVTWL